MPGSAARLRRVAGPVAVAASRPRRWRSAGNAASNGDLELGGIFNTPKGSSGAEFPDKTMVSKGVFNIRGMGLSGYWEETYIVGVLVR